MRRKLLAALALILTASLLSGCDAILEETSKKYSYEEEKALLKKGEDIMANYFEREALGAYINSAEARIESQIGQPTFHYLSEYVHGEFYCPNIQSRAAYEVNTETGEVFTSEYWGELEDLLLEELVSRLPPELEYESVTLIHSVPVLPHCCERFGHSETTFRHFEECGEAGNYGLWNIQFSNVLPAELTDVAAYLANEDARETIYASLRITLPDNSNPGSIDPASIPRERDGIVLEHLILWNAVGTKTIMYCGGEGDEVWNLPAEKPSDESAIGSPSRTVEFP